MNKATITIIIPAFNTEKYIEQALNSIKEQSEQPDEVILIDDGSTDNTYKIANSYNFDFNYLIIKTKNQGLGATRNLGIARSSSQYIYFFDSDDIINKNFIKDVKEHIFKENHPDIIFFSGSSFNDKDYKGTRWLDYKRNFNGIFQSRELFLQKGSHAKGLFSSACLYISKKEIWDKNNLLFKDIIHEDEEIFFPLIFSCNNFLVLNEKYFLRRNRNGSIMTSNITFKNTKGLLECIRTQSIILNQKNTTQLERKIILEKLHEFILIYIKRSRQIKQKIKIMTIIRITLKTKDLNTTKSIALYYLRIYQLLHYIKNTYFSIRFK